MNILHGLTGSIATTLYPKIDSRYSDDPEYSAKYIATSSALAIEVLQEPNKIYVDYDEWLVYNNQGKVLHIELMKWADVFVIAPCSANTLAKIAGGICDNLLTCVARAWDFDKRIIVAPSMNNLMYNHPVTQKHLNIISEWGYDIVPPVEKKLYCGDIGIGAMANINDILEKIKS